MRRYLVWILAALCALLPAAGLAAENRDTQLTTTLPHEHTIAVVCGAGGAVRVDGMVYTGAHAFTVDRLSAFILEAVPDEGYRLSQVKAQPSGSVSISGNTVSIGSVYEDKALTLSFVKQDEPAPTPDATATASPGPTSSSTATASPRPTSMATASPAPAAETDDEETDTIDTPPHFDLPEVVPNGNVLYDEYLGTGVGQRDIGIVYDEVYDHDEYEVLTVQYDAELAQANMMLVIAQPDANGEYEQNSMILSGVQLARLWQEKEIKWIELRCGDVSALLRIDELLKGDVAKFIAWALSDPEAARPDGVEDLPEVELTVDELKDVHIEVRITQVEAEGYRIGVYALYKDRQTAIGELIPSFMIGLNAGEQGNEEERDMYIATHCLSATDGSGKTTNLTGTLQELLWQEVDEHVGDSEYFNVSMDAGNNMVVLYDPDMPLDNYRRCMLCADWVGDATYSLVTLELEQ